ncbi:trehalase-like domain-containing protein [Geodermatophilus sp. SYSU D00766]
MTARIEDHGLVGDLQTAALVDRTGTVDWLCLPRFDSPACFAALLGDERAGSWVLAPHRGGTCTRRRYRGDSLVLETEWQTPEGTVRVVDLMPPRGQAPSPPCSGSSTTTACCGATAWTPTAASTGWPVTRGRSWPAASGWPRRCSPGCSACATTSACSARSCDVAAGRQVGNTPQALQPRRAGLHRRHLSGTRPAARAVREGVRSRGQ